MVFFVGIPKSFDFRKKTSKFDIGKIVLIHSKFIFLRHPGGRGRGGGAGMIKGNRPTVVQGEGWGDVA